MLRSNRPGGDQGTQPVEAVEDGPPEDELFHGGTEEYDDQDYRRYGYARALLHPADKPFHKRLLDRQFRRVAEPFEDEDAERGYDNTKEEGTDADGRPGPDPRQDASPRTRKPKGCKKIPSLLAEPPHPGDSQQNPPDHDSCDGGVKQNN